MTAELHRYIPGFDHHAVLDHHRDVAVPHQKNTARAA